MRSWEAVSQRASFFDFFTTSLPFAAAVFALTRGTGRDGTVFARGMAAAEARVLRRTAGQRTRDLPADVAHEAIHRDDLVVLP